MMLQVPAGFEFRFQNTFLSVELAPQASVRCHSSPHLQSWVQQAAKPEVHIDMDASTVADEMSSLAPSSPRSQYGVQWSQEEHLPSRGSSLHELGQCKPCAWFWKEGGCDRFADCDYCHLCDLSTLEASVKERRRETRRVKRQQARCAKAASRAA